MGCVDDQLVALRVFRCINCLFIYCTLDLLLCIYINNKYTIHNLRQSPNIIDTQQLCHSAEITTGQKINPINKLRIKYIYYKKTNPQLFTICLSTF